MGILERFLGKARNGRAGAAAHERPVAESAPETEPLDEIAALLVARWPAAQRTEYARYGRGAREAALALEEGRFAEARQAFEALLARADEPCFLLRDVGRARLASGDPRGAEEALRTFLAKAPEELESDLRLETHLDLVRVAGERGDVEAAIEELGAAIDALPDDPRPYFLMGQYLARTGHPAEALDVLRSAMTVAGGEPSSEVLEEVGRCQLALGRMREAESALAEVVRRAKCRCGARVPEATALALASIYEATGRAAEARELLAGVGRASCGTH